MQHNRKPFRVVLGFAALGCSVMTPETAPASQDTTPHRTPESAPRADSPAAGDAPYVLVLGTSQDGGLPQIGCEAAPCERARRDPAARRMVTSLLLVDPASGQRWLFDATPDLPDQVERFDGHPATRDLPGPRPPLVDGIFLTHAHMGHYTGLLHLGREAYGARELPLHVTSRMGEFLSTNGPWSLMVEAGNVRLETLLPGRAVRLTDALSVTALLVPHRDELSDTVAFLIEGPERSVLYLPDIDKWEHWETPIEEVIAGVDVALVDATFFDGDEVPGRDLTKIPHPFVVESLERFAPLPAEERAKIRFTHLNHSNPVADPTSEAARRVRDAGMHVASDLEVHPLGG